MTLLGVLTLYRHPRDFPTHYVTRWHWPQSDGSIEAAPVACLYTSADEARFDVRRQHGDLFWMVRQAGDDPCIVGVWI